MLIFFFFSFTLLVLKTVLNASNLNAFIRAREEKKTIHENSEKDVFFLHFPTDGNMTIFFFDVSFFVPSLILMQTKDGKKSSSTAFPSKCQTKEEEKIGLGQ